MFFFSPSAPPLKSQNIALRLEKRSTAPLPHLHLSREVVWVGAPSCFTGSILAVNFFFFFLSSTHENTQRLTAVGIKEDHEVHDSEGVR